MNVVLDDRLLIEEMLVGLGRPDVQLHTTTYWYYRACRAAVLGATGHLSGPFRQLANNDQERAIVALLQLPDEVGLVDPRRLVPVMVEIAGRHSQLNILNVEAVATSRALNAVTWLSPESARGALPPVLESEHLDWDIIAIE